MTKDAADIAPHVCKVVFENERIRLLEVRIKPGAKSALHAHPDYLVYTIEGGTVTLTAASGESAEVELPSGSTMWSEAEEHSAVNTGTTELVPSSWPPSWQSALRPGRGRDWAVRGHRRNALSPHVRRTRGCLGR